MSTTSILKLVLVGGLLAFRPGERGSMGTDQKAGIALLAGAAGLAAISPTVNQFAHGIRGPARAPAKVIYLRPARPKGTRTRPGAKPTKTRGPAPGAGGKPRNAVFAISMCVLVAGGTAAMVLGQSSSSSSAGEENEELGDVQDVPTSGEDAANGSDGDSSAPGDAPDDPSGVDDKSDAVCSDAHGYKGDVGGSPPPPPPPSETTSGSDDGKKGYTIYGLDWKALFIPLAVIAAIKKYKALRAMKADEEDPSLAQDDIHPAQDALEVQEYSIPYLRDAVNAGLLATASCAAFASSKYSAISSHFTDFATVVDDKDKQLALIYNVLAPNVSTLPGEVGMCPSDFGSSLDPFKAVEMPWEWDNNHHEDQPPITLHFVLSPKEALEQVVASGSGSPVEEEPATPPWGYHYGIQMKAFVKYTLLVVLVAVVAYLTHVIDRLNAAIEASDQVSRQHVMVEEQSACDIEEEEIVYDAPSESTGTVIGNDSHVDFASNAAVVGQEVADEEPMVEEPEQPTLIDMVAEVVVRTRSVSSPAIFTSPIKEVEVIESLAPSMTLADHISDPAPAPHALEPPASTPAAPPTVEIASTTPAAQETLEVFAIPVVGGERPRRRVRGGRRSHTRAGRGRGNGQAGGPSTYV